MMTDFFNETNVWVTRCEKGGPDAEFQAWPDEATAKEN